jgi:hypothetical protein
LRDPQVRSGAIHTGYVDEALAQLTVSADPPIEAIAAAARADALPAAAATAASDAPDPWSALLDWGR